MKTRLLAGLFAILLITLLCSCKSKNNDNTSDSGNGDLNDNNETGSLPGTDNGGEDEPKNEYSSIIIKNANSFSDGVAYVNLLATKETDGLTVTEEFPALINTKGEILHKFIDENYSSRNITFKNGVYHDSTKIYNKSFDVIASPESHGYDEIIYFIDDRATYSEHIQDCGYFLVHKTESTSETEKHLFGVIDINGDYTVPLSSEHPISTQLEECGYKFKDIGIFYVGGGYYSINYYKNIDEEPDYYNVSKNKITSDYHRYAQIDYEFMEIDEDGNENIIFTDYFLENVSGSIYLRDPFESGDDNYVLIDILTQNILINFGKYELITDGTASYRNGYLLAKIKGPEGKSYCCLFNSNGKTVFDPIFMSASDAFSSLSDEGFFVQKSGIIYFYDYEGNRTEYTPPNNAANTSIYGCSGGWTLIRIEYSDSTYEYKFINSSGNSLY